MRYRVGVLPPAAFRERRRLWWALEQAFPVHFEAVAQPQAGHLDGLIAHGEVSVPTPAVPLLCASKHDERCAGEHVQMARSLMLPQCLRGQRMSDERAALMPPLALESGETVLAASAAGALWVKRTAPTLRHRCAALPLELGGVETLRERLRAGRFIGLLPLLGFLGDLTAELSWSMPATRAAFIFDDPNLHWPTYGHLHFSEIAERAARGGFHVALATVPLDAWYANRRVVELLRAHRALSLLMHGNEHRRCELGRLADERDALALASQAVRRIAALERRTGLSVARVMAPPHGECSEVALGALRRAGILAACMSRPYPWRDRAPADHPLAQWETTDVVSGLPVLPRYSLGSSREDLPLRAFLGQPLIVYGHHGDLAEGPEVLEEIAAEINCLGTVKWGDLTSIARGSFHTRREDDLLRVRMLAGEIDVQLDPGVNRIIFEMPGAGERDGAAVQIQTPGRSIATRPGEELRVGAGERTLRARLCFADGVNPQEVSAPRRGLWPPARRLLVQGRDRLSPMLRAGQGDRRP